MILAETANNADFLWHLLDLTVIACSIVCPILMLVFMRSDKKQRREISFEFNPVSAEIFEKHVADNKREHENIFSKIGGVERGAQAHLEAVIKASDESRERLHKRINDIMVGVARIEGQLEEQKNSK